ncbi:MAG: PepSY-associated TM helix domain-containing protein [Methylococcaceae bacterium]|nr:PepSY-associated TM helix domain-containing protein [Methylococcaceae bacterium]
MKTTTIFSLNKKIRRKFWLKVHLYIGLCAGAVFVLIGLAGSLSVFGPELDSALNSTLKKVQLQASPSTYRSLNDIAAAAKSVIPISGKAYALVFPDQADDAFCITYSLPAQGMNQNEWHQVYVNPYTAQVTGQRLMFDTGNSFRGALMNFFVRFHYTLALGEVGRTFVGIVALLLVFSILTGLIVWWPSVGKFRQALSLKRHASIERFNFDLHKTVGFYSLIILLIVLISGVEMVFPVYVDGLVKVLLSVTPKAEAPVSDTVSPALPITLDQVVAITDSRFPDGSYKWIFFPQGERNVFRVVKRAPDEVNQTRPSRTLWLDQYTGKLLQEREPAKNAAGDTLLQWLYPLHSGEAFGLTGRILICISGLAPAVLYVTGLIRWLQKRRAKRSVKLPG